MQVIARILLRGRNVLNQPILGRLTIGLSNSGAEPNFGGSQAAAGTRVKPLQAVLLLLCAWLAGHEVIFGQGFPPEEAVKRMKLPE